MLTKEIKSAQHRLIKHLVKLQKERSYRHKKGTFVLEGKKCICERGAAQRVKRLFIQRGEACPEGILCDECYILSETLMQKISDVRSPESVIAEVDMPSPSTLESKKKILVLDGLADPGNLGTLVRTAVGFGFDAVFLRADSVDLFNPKTVRASKGALFHLPYTYGNVEDIARFAAHNGFHLYLADLRGMPLASATFSLPLMLVLGSEAHGVSPSLKQKGTAIAIPLAEQVESLNVACAGAVLMHHMRAVLWPD